VVRSPYERLGDQSALRTEAPVDDVAGYGPVLGAEAEWQGMAGAERRAPPTGSAAEQAGFLDDDAPTQPQYGQPPPGPAPVTVFPVHSDRSGGAHWMGRDPAEVAQPPTAVAPSMRLVDLASSHRVLGDASAEPFEVRRDLVLISVRGELLTRLSGLIAYGGVLDFKPERKRFRGRLTDRSFGDGADQMTRAKGNGVLMLETNQRSFLTTDIAGESAYFREDVVFAFEEPLAFENGRLPSDMTPDLDLVYLRGQGQVLLCPGGPVRSVEVTSVRPFTVPLENLVGWYGNLTPRIAILAFDESGKVIRAGVELSGDGFLLFSSLIG
jgi:hypothetical protein